MNEIQQVIDQAFERRGEITPRTAATHVKDAVLEAIELLDSGKAHVATKSNDTWVVNEWLKKAVLLYFRIEDNSLIKGSFNNYYDKIPSKFVNYSSHSFRERGFRVVPPATVRYGAYVAPSVVLMPSYINIGAYVD